jgi:hypothetical protein
VVIPPQLWTFRKNRAESGVGGTYCCGYLRANLPSCRLLAVGFSGRVA